MEETEIEQEFNIEEDEQQQQKEDIKKEKRKKKKKKSNKRKKHHSDKEESEHSQKDDDEKEEKKKSKKKRKKHHHSDKEESEHFEKNDKEEKKQISNKIKKKDIKEQITIIETVHCIGVINIENRESQSITPCLMMIKKYGKGKEKGKLYCIEMDDLSSLMTSPLYEHEITIEEMEPNRKNDSYILNYFTNEKIYKIKEWKQCIYRIDDDKWTIGKIYNKLQEIINETLYISFVNFKQRTNTTPISSPIKSKSSVNINIINNNRHNNDDEEQDGNSKYLNFFNEEMTSKSKFKLPIFSPHNNKEHRDFLKYWLERFNDLSNTKSKEYKDTDNEKNIIRQTKGSFYKKFWKMFNDDNSNSHVINTIEQIIFKSKEEDTSISNSNMDQHKINYILMKFPLSLLNGFYHYFRNHITDLHNIYRLINFDKVSISLSSLSIYEINDLREFSFILNDCFFIKIDYVPSSYNPLKKFNNYKHLIDNVIKDKLFNLFDIWKERLETFNKFPDMNIIRNNLIDYVIIPKIVIDFENLIDCTIKTDKSVINIFKKKNVKNSFNYLLKLNQIHEKEEEENEKLIDITFTEENLDEIIERVILNGKGFKYDWIRIKEEGESSSSSLNKKPGYRLFYIILNKMIFELEKQNYNLITKEVNEKNLIKSDLHIGSSQCNFEWLGNDLTIKENKDEFNFHHILYSIIELKEEEDLDMINNILCNHVHETVIIRPSNNYQSLKRLYNYFNKTTDFPFKSDKKTFYDSICIENIRSKLDSKKSALPIIIIYDAHLFSENDYSICMNWIMKNRSVIYKVIFIGSIDVLPLFHGSPFINLLLIYHKNLITDLKNPFPSSSSSSLIYQNQQNSDIVKMNDSFNLLLNSYWDSIPYMIQQNHFDFNENGGKSKIYYIEQMSLLINFICDVINSTKSKPKYIFFHSLYISQNEITKSDKSEYSHTSINKDNIYLFINNNVKPLCRGGIDVTNLHIDQIQSLNVFKNCNSTFHFFIISKKVLFSLSRFYLIYLFTILDHLIIINDDHEKHPNVISNPHQIKDQIIDKFKSSMKGAFRYTYMSLID